MIYNLGKYIELIGVAGVGKTTSAKILVDEVLKINISIRIPGVVDKNLWFRLQIIYTIMTIIISAPEILSLYFVSIRNDYKNTPHVRRTIRNLLTRMIIDTAIIRCLLRTSSEYILNDEGLIGKLVSLSVITKISPSKVHALIERLLPKPVILVYIMSDPIIALERERTRDIKLPFFNDMAYELKDKFFSEAVRTYEALPSAVVSMSNVEVLSIDNDGTYNDLTKKVQTVAQSIIALILRS